MGEGIGMEAQKAPQLYQKNQSIEFYETRYKKGYMEYWPNETKRKIFEVIRGLQLPETGDALDFGCGNGILTEILRQALPNWKVYGADVSKTAIENAKRCNPHGTFFVLNDSKFKQKKFDFLFSHHVFEHVYNLSEVFCQMESYLKRESSMLHFLPCGNEGSYEYNICILKNDGINKELGNRFFYEDQGHVRRLTTNECCELFKAKNFKLQKEFYSYQYYGALLWITDSSPQMILKISDSFNAVDKEAKNKIKKIRRQLILIKILRLPAQIVNKVLDETNKQLKHYLLLMLGLPFYVFSSPIDKYWKRKASIEWEENKAERNGSEMGLFFKRWQKI